ncbi:hypothetical protein TNCV_3622181 [Trichonephila clavipes]|nr:hypothetical protein TNCV_3622181 [Trichonephila clavipes]
MILKDLLNNTRAGIDNTPVDVLEKIVRVQYFVRGGFVGYRSRASSKASLPSSSGRRARFLGGSNKGCVAPARCTCGCRVHKESRLDVDVFEK